MTALILPSRRFIQPQGPVELNQSHWAGVRCFKAITPANRHLLRIGSNSAFFTGPKGGEFGVSVVNSSAASVSISDPALVRTAGGASRSFLVVYRRFGGPTLTPSVFVEETPGNFFRNAFLFQGSWVWRTRDITTGDSGASRDLTVTAPVAGAIEIRIFSVAAGIKKAYLNGKLDATSANGNQFTSTDSNAFQFAHASGSGADFTGDSRVSLFASFDGVFTDAEAKGLSENPWQIFRPIQRRIIVDMGAGGAAVDLVPADASHAHTADSVVLSTSTSLTVNSAEHAHTAENVALATATALTAANASHAQSADSLTLGTTAAVDLAVADSSHAHAAGSVALVVASFLAVDDSTHAHSAENVVLTIGGIGLSVSDATHSQAAESLTLSADSFLIAADATHGHTADLLTLSTATFFVVDDAVHAQTADHLSLDGAPTLQVAAAEHQHTAETVALTMESWLEAANAAHGHTAQNVTLGGGDREYDVFEGRTLDVAGGRSTTLPGGRTATFVR